MRVCKRIIVLFVALLAILAGCKEEANEPLQEIAAILDSGYYTLVKSLIDSARTSVELMMFLVSDTTDNFGEPGGLLAAISDAYSRGVNVRILLHSIGDIINESAVQFFENREIPLRIADKYSHTKLLIIDGKTVVLGSHNWTTSAFGSNYEASVIIRDEATAYDYRNYFNEHYDEGMEP
ncbi:hypothetical protein CH333_09305 [candidate division WOR-3 bacterium JGI_Cruoil_03_44_89]|uniref:phospholipase D n=1 Tax=candidate division WOR-3 bacterium JGI_Cruoil_03_44_89 TaxID=1973748 RepID=A0A235BP94_UNCW3|nr:MAG: hypothetical protein CH333_09305 [candidate division WOR-3 bacterium JGI_Cruoil_03_44_89]